MAQALTEPTMCLCTRGSQWISLSWSCLVGFSAHVKPTNPEIMNPTVDLHLVQRKHLPLWFCCVPSCLDGKKCSHYSIPPLPARIVRPSIIVPINCLCSRLSLKQRKGLESETWPTIERPSLHLHLCIPPEQQLSTLTKKLLGIPFSSHILAQKQTLDYKTQV